MRELLATPLRWYNTGIKRKRMTRSCLLILIAVPMAQSAIGRDAVVASGPWEMEQASAPGKWMLAILPVEKASAEAWN